MGKKEAILWVSHGLRKLGSRFWVTKLKKEVSWEYRVRLVSCLVPWLKSVRKERTSSGVREFRSLSPNWAVNLERIDW